MDVDPRQLSMRLCVRCGATDVDTVRAWAERAGRCAACHRRRRGRAA